MHMTITMASKSEPTDVAEIMLKIVPETANKYIKHIGSLQSVIKIVFS